MKEQYGFYGVLFTLMLLVMLIAADITVSSAASIQLPKTGQTTSYAAGDDGSIQKGVAWPAQRFANNGDGTTTDNLTGIAWTTNANAPGPDVCSPGVTKTWQDALAYVDCLNSNNYLGHADWRMPNVNELVSLMQFGDTQAVTWLTNQDFTDVSTGWYWSSTSGTPYPDTYAITVQFNSLTTYNDSGMNKGATMPVWPARGGTGGVISLPKTGQTVSYAAGDDGSLQTGVAWPSPRFTNNGDGTSTDNLTGLMWTTNTYSPGPAACNPGVTMTFQTALDYVACLNTNNYLGHSDWRLPNIVEAASILNFGQSSVSAWLQTQGFSSGQWNGWYWSCTRNPFNTNYNIMEVDLANPAIGSATSNTALFSYGKVPAWPVRGGE